MTRCVECGVFTDGTAGLPGGNRRVCHRCLAEYHLGVVADLVEAGVVCPAAWLIRLMPADQADEADLAPY